MLKFRNLLFVFFLSVMAFLPSTVLAGSVFVQAFNLTDKRIQVFAIDNAGEISSRWKTTTAPNASWTGWSGFQTPGGGVNSLGGAYLSDGRIQLFATDKQGVVWSCWKSNTDPNASWTGWGKF